MAKSPDPVTNGTATRQDRRLAIGLFALFLGLYSRTLAPGLLFGDPGEFQFAAWRFGLAHPTGYPLYLLLGGGWQQLAGLFGVDPAASLNAFSALLTAVAVAICYLAVLGWLPKRTSAARVSAFFAALLIGVNPTLWSQALIAEVYALHALFIALFLLLTARFSRPPDHPFSLSPLPLVILSLLLGLALTHHRTTLFLLPGFLLWLFWREQNWWRKGRLWASLIGGVALPQLLYLYIPLRSGVDASPWLYPRLGAETLALYTPTFQGFVDFITGAVFAVSFLSPAQALIRLPEMGNLWIIHFTWPGLALALLGLVVLFRERRWSLLLVTFPAALLLQIFNLFYGIGDIYVFYIPLYLFAALWSGCAVNWLIGLTERRRTADRGEQAADDRPKTADESPNPQSPIPNPQYHFWFAILLLLPASLFLTHFPSIDRSNDNTARQMWDRILAAQPPADAILVSNDRNEIVPLYYLQAVEGKATGLTGLFPLLTPEERFGDVGAVTETALEAGERPVYLIKEMAGLDAKFDLDQATPPLVRVVGAVHGGMADHPHAMAYGPLTLLGYSVSPRGDTSQLSLFWRVEEKMGANYTTSIQLFDGAGVWLGQDDRPPGGDFYPTSLWKAGEIVRDSHLFPAEVPGAAAKMQVLLYTRASDSDGSSEPALIQLAPALEVSLR